MASHTATVPDCKIGQDAFIAIIGAGPTGLGAANRLHELGYQNFAVFDKESYPGGLAASFVDRNEFVWDIGGHVHFSHYEYFDDLMNDLLPNEWLSHDRESWIWIHGQFVPYPFQSPPASLSCANASAALFEPPAFNLTPRTMRIGSYRALERASQINSCCLIASKSGPTNRVI